MKSVNKIFLALFFCCLVSPRACGDAAWQTVGAGELSPPEWLVGSWARADGRTGEDVEMAGDNVILFSGNLDLNAQIEKYGLEVRQNLDAEIYSLAYTSGGQNFIYAFEPADGGMKCTVTMDTLKMDAMYKKTADEKKSGN